MDVHVLSLFPEMLHGFLRASIVGRALEEERVRVHDVQIRSYSTNKHRTVDDTPYGGGSGMVMAAPPLVAAIESLPGTEGMRPHVILLTPSGRLFTQRDAERLATLPAIALVCGRYEGMDARVTAYVDEELSIGDYVLTGGELGAAVILDAVVRLLPGVLGNQHSSIDESHGRSGTLEYPQYTRPAVFRDVAVPLVLQKGDHKKIALWRRWHALRRTRTRRPDLFAAIALTEREQKWLDGEEPQ
ncbi:MAG: tRNA (guanosine(37)-N1)-methyltransferase TrmD [Deltaproteobacteria bacterium]|nr:tRNA (guanosine(37)-N1)-methyltransferase TrmD [Deltaproteobacteria bacterium]